jgi:hypothetical protein
MGLVGILAGAGLFLVLLWNFAIYVLPAFVGFSTGWWALNHGAGVGCVLVGLVAGIVTFLAGRAALKSGNVPLFWLAISLFTLLAAYAFYNIVLQVSEAGVPSTVWRHIFAVVGATLLAGATFKRLVAEGRS